MLKKRPEIYSKNGGFSNHLMQKLYIIISVLICVILLIRFKQSQNKDALLSVQFDFESSIARPSIDLFSAVFLRDKDHFLVFKFKDDPKNFRICKLDRNGQFLEEIDFQTGYDVRLEGRRIDILPGQDKRLYFRFSSDWQGVSISLAPSDYIHFPEKIALLNYNTLWEHDAKNRLIESAGDKL